MRHAGMEPVTNSTVGLPIRLCDVEPEREIRTIMMTGSSIINWLGNIRQQSTTFLKNIIHGFYDFYIFLMY